MSDPADLVYEVSKATIGLAVSATLGGIWWLVSRIFTNKAQIDALRQEIAARADLERERALHRDEQVALLGRQIAALASEVARLGERIDRVLER